MKFSINQSELLAALQTVEKGSSTHGALPILSGVLVQASVDMITLSTTDGTLSVRTTANALVDEEGEGVLPTKLFLDVVKSLPNEAVVVHADDSKGSVACGTASFNMKTFPSEDFPNFPDVEAQSSITLVASQFSRMVRHVAKDVSKDESRAILTGIDIHASDGVLKMTATDSYRLAIIEMDFDNNGQEFEAVVAGGFLSDLAGLTSSSDENVEIDIAENQVIVRFGRTTFVNRRIEGTYPPISRLLPKDHKTRVTFKVDDLMTAVKRVALLTNKTAPIKFSVDAASGTVTLSTDNPDVGSASESLSAKVEGEDVETAFNAFYTIDGLSSMDTEEVVLDSQESMRPSVFRSTEPERFTYLIMPVRLS